MGEAQRNLFEPQFNRAIKVQTTKHRLTSNAGVVLLREADQRLGIISSIAANIDDPRHPAYIRYGIDELIRERVFAMATGHQTQDDVDRLAHDPAFRAAAWNRSGDEVIDQRLASQPTQSRLIDILALNRDNTEALRDGLSDTIERHVMASGGRLIRSATIDIDSFPIQVHGEQQGASYNGYYRDTVYHPLVASLSVGGDYDNPSRGTRLGNGFIHATLRQGQVHTANGMQRFVENVDAKAKKIARNVDYRVDAGYTIPAVMDRMYDHDMKFVGRLKSSAKLDALAAAHLHRPAGRPPKEGYEYTVELGPYQIDSWRHAQRLILVVVDRPDPITGQLNLLPNYFFLVTNWSKSQRSGSRLLSHYRKRGTFEDRLGEFNSAIGVHLSHKSFQENSVAMLLGMLSFNLCSLCRIELEDALHGSWDLTRFQLFVLKVGGEIIKHARRAVLRIADSAEYLWEKLIDRMQRWSLPARYSLPGRQPSGYVQPPAHAHRSEVLRM